MIVGMKFRGTERLVAGLQQGEPLTFVREPTNEHDKNAVQIWARDVHVGYVKGAQAKDVARFMDDGKHERWPAILAVTADRWPSAEFDTVQKAPPKIESKTTTARPVKEGWKNG